MEMLFDKCDNIASLATAKALVDSTLRVNVKRGCLFLVKRTQPEVVATCMTQLYILAYHVNDVRPRSHFFDDMLGNTHVAKILAIRHWGEAMSLQAITGLCPKTIPHRENCA
jgi:hypothetical protein